MELPTVFTLLRHQDETGVSGTGRVLDGIIFHTGQVVICWRSDLNENSTGFSSVAIYPSWEAFLSVHVRPHAEGAAEVVFFGKDNS